MTPRAYYNEKDAYAAQWLRNLIAAGLIASGDVDERSIVDVRPEDLEGYTQCHFFAGIGCWSEALHLAGWPDERPVWTGSCPCQPLSVAGPRTGHLDERHLWPAFHRLIDKRHPAAVFGEQSASKAGREWLAGVRLDLESSRYACGAANLCSGGIGSPNIRQRSYWAAYADGGHAGAEWLQRGGQYGQFAQDGRGAEGLANAASARSLPGALTRISRGEKGAGPRYGEFERRGCCGAEGLANAGHEQAWRSATAGEAQGGRPFGDAAGCDGDLARLGDAQGQRLLRRPDDKDGGGRQCSSGQAGQGIPEGLRDAASEGLQGQWREYRPSGERHRGLAGYAMQAGVPQWNGATIAVKCSDGARRISAQPDAFPLAAGSKGRMGRLRAYGNAINAKLAAEFIIAAEEARLAA